MNWRMERLFMCPNSCRMVPFLFGSFLLSALQLSGKEMFAGRMPSDVLYEDSLHCPHPERVLKGVVYDAAHEPLPGVTVRVLNTSWATVTDLEGRFELCGLWPKGATIEFRCMGMRRQTVTYAGQPEMHVRLEDETRSMGTVEVSAKANINEIDLRARSGVVQSIDMRRIESKPMIDMGLALQGSVPGLVVVNTGELGAEPKIRIRGNSSLRKGNLTNEPLYVLDGKVIAAETFYNLNPTDIQDIKVLKDAAACALYGVKAANGVLEITSKRGSSGETTVSYSVDMGVTTRGRRGIRMMDSAEKLELERLLQNPETPGYRYSADFYRKYYADAPNLEELIAEGQSVLDSLSGIHTDWYKKLLHNNLYQKHHVSIRGGSDRTTYFASAHYTAQGGRIPGNDKQRMGIRLNLDQRLGRAGYLLLGMNGGYSRTNTPNGSSSDPASLIYELNPYEQTTGKLYSYPGRTFQDLLQEYSAKASEKDAGVSASLTLNPLPGLDIAAVGGLDFLLHESEQFTPSTAYSETHGGIPEVERGIYSKAKNVTLNLSGNVRITYNHVFAGRHDLTLGANTDYYQTQLDQVGMTGYGVGTINSAAAINQSLQGNRQPKVSGLKDKTAQIGLGAVAGYTFDSTYDLYATCKWDASSVLPADKRWNSAWAVGAGWTPTAYDFLDGNPILTHLKLKASYGYTANLNGVSAAATVATFAYSANVYEDQRLLELITLYNKDLKPEQTKSVDAGISLELWNRLTLDVNWYNRRTEQALLDVPIPTSTGFTNLQRNIGILQNRGIEVGLSARLVDTPEWMVRIGVNMAYNRNKVIDLYYADKIYSSDQALVPDYEIGKSYDMLYGPISLGINPLTGYPMFWSEKNGEKQATEVLEKEDLVALGHLTPPYTGSINLSMSYKSFDLDMDFYYVHGGVQAFKYTYVRDKDDVQKNAVAGQTANMWFRPGDENKIYATPFNTSGIAENNMLLLNSLTVGQSDYLRLSMLSLRYRLAARFLRKYLPFVQYANVALRGSNLFTWTTYRESDPESGTLAGTLQPVYSVNVNLTF